MVIRPVQRNPVEEFVVTVKEALKKKNTKDEIRKAVDVLLKSYGIETPDKK